jgi:alpha-galactosidase/6-phospho-beta-glucosidase family protein
MGGAPSISGGMTQAEYSALLDKQRADSEASEARMREFYEGQMLKQEETARKLAEEMRSKEQAEVEKAKQAERSLMQEAEFQQNQQQGTTEGQEEEEEGNITDFYGSLYEGTEQRPE